ncbi:hypothetical protein GCM10009551_046640 [Nocardiopsis tropica]
MPPPHRETLTPGQGMSTGTRRGLVSGFVLRLAREQLSLSREVLAERLLVSPDTLAAWETGRRPLTAVPIGQLLTHRHALLRLGVQPVLLAALDRALESDVLLAMLLRNDPGALAGWVLQRDLVEFLVWPLTGQPPEPLKALTPRTRRGPSADRPTLTADERNRLSAHLRRMAETADGFLLRRQALYLSGYDTIADSADWFTEQQRRSAPRDALSRWLAERSVASVATMRGDRDRLARFVSTTLVNDDWGEAANLAYWSYWVGETGPELTDDFMATGRVGPWGGHRLYRHLLDRLAPEHGNLDLYVHTMWALIAVKPHLLRNPEPLAEQVGLLLDGGGVSAVARRDLDGIRYAIRLSRA